MWKIITDSAAIPLPERSGSSDRRTDRLLNVGYGYVYYQVNGEEACLKCMRDDGSDSRVIAEGNYTAINMTSQYVYFQTFGCLFPLWAVVARFDAASQALGKKNNVTSHEI